MVAGAGPDLHATVRLVVVVGTRPEAIKMIPVVKALRETDLIQPYVLSTGQHKELVAELFHRAGLKIDGQLELTRERGDLNEVFTQVMMGVNALLDELAHDDPEKGIPLTAGVIVHGDTSSAAAAALAAMNRRVPVMHVEAGLRTGDWWQPYPEELNRQLISRLAAMHYAPTRRNLANLIRESISEGRIFVTGNTAVDAALWAVEQPVEWDDELGDWLAGDHRVITVTAHRRENWGAGIAGIAEGVRRIAAAHPELRIVMSLHPNPDVRATVRPILGEVPNVLLTEPIDYLPFAHLIKRSYLTITDSGGIQEEAPAVGTAVLVCREETERQEGLEAGTLRLVGTDPAVIAAATEELLTDEASYQRMITAKNPYGDGRAAERIRESILHLANLGPPPVSFSAGYNRSEVLEVAGYGEFAEASSTLRAPGWEPPEKPSWWYAADTDWV